MSNKELQTGSIDIPLASGVTIQGTKVTALRMREPTVADQLVAAESGGSNAQQEIVLMANLCGIAPAELKSLTMRDYNKVQKAYLGFTD